MMRSLYSGVSGLQNHQTRMDVVGNNIANINTTGFKRGRVNFQDMLSQNMSGAARPTEELGGVNPRQVGLGMTVATIDTIHTQGSLQTTGVNTDVAVQGQGFFILRNGNQELYTRNGAFGLDVDGRLVNPANGLKVQGWMAETVNGEQILQTSAPVEDLIIPVGGKDPARATGEVNLASNLDKRTTVIPPGAGPEDVASGTWRIDETIYDSFGNQHRFVVEFTRDADNPDIPNQWVGTILVNPDDTEFDYQLAAGIGDAPAGNTFTLNFDNLGTMETLTDAQGNTIAEGRVQLPISFQVPGANEGDPTSTQTFNLNMGEIGSYESSVTQYAERSSTRSYFQDGYTMGYLENFLIDQSGMITGVYTNGTNRVIGQVALASFINPGGLAKEGESTYVRTNNSGQANISAANEAGKGGLIAGALEMSNVDMAVEFTDMIVTQRGFQANSKTIQTSDQMLQELLTLKR